MRARTDVLRGQFGQSWRRQIQLLSLFLAVSLACGQYREAAQLGSTDTQQGVIGGAVSARSEQHSASSGRPDDEMVTQTETAHRKIRLA